MGSRQLKIKGIVQNIISKMLKLVSAIMLMSVISCYIDPSHVFMDCMDQEDNLNLCCTQALGDSRLVTGVPELGIASLDPMLVDELEFTFFNLTTSSRDSIIKGFGDYKMEKCVPNTQKGIWNIEFSVPKLTSKESCSNKILVNYLEKFIFFYIFKFYPSSLLRQHTLCQDLCLQILTLVLPQAILGLEEIMFMQLWLLKFNLMEKLLKLQM